MKKLVLIISVCLFTLTAFSKEVPSNYYLSSNNEMLFCKKIRLNKESIKAVLDNGKRVIIPTSDIKMYRMNGKIYEKLPVYINNKKTSKEAFMQFVTTRAGLRLYKYSSWEEVIDRQNGAYLGVAKVDKYCVYKGDQLWVSVNERNYPTVLNFFGVTYK